MYKYEVEDISLISPSVLLLTLVPKNRKHMKFYPGQYVALNFKRFGRPTPMRCFSIASSPTNSKSIQFAVKIQGDFTNALSEIKPGDPVDMMGPFGEFVIDSSIDKRVILLAGGIGVTPFISMIRYATDVQLKLPIVLMFSNQTQDDVPFYEELIEHEKKNPYFKVAFFITSGNTNKLNSGRIFSGRITEKALNQVTDNLYNSFTHFVCGPNNFMKAIQSILISKNVSPDHLITEAFGQGIVTEKSHKKKSKETRFVYAMTGFLLIAGTVFITGIDLVRAVPKINAIENPNSSNSTAANNTSGVDTSSNSLNTNNPTSSSSTNTNSNNNNSSSNSSNSTPVTQVNNSSPITSVS